MFTVDASVHINALNPAEAGSAESQACLQHLVVTRQPLFSPIIESLRPCRMLRPDAGEGSCLYPGEDLNL
jgi:hypothetical protein